MTTSVVLFESVPEVGIVPKTARGIREVGGGELPKVLQAAKGVLVRLGQRIGLTIDGPAGDITRQAARQSRQETLFAGVRKVLTTAVAAGVVLAASGFSMDAKAASPDDFTLKRGGVQVTAPQSGAAAAAKLDRLKALNMIAMKKAAESSIHRLGGAQSMIVIGKGATLNGSVTNLAMGGGVAKTIIGGIEP